jgi:hypothetical protein
MAHRCKSISGQKVILEPGDRIIPGCELIDGSAFIKGDEIGSCLISDDIQSETKAECLSAGGTWIITCEGGIEVFSPLFFDEGDMCAYAGGNGCSVLWPDVGNDLFQYDEGESVPIGTTIHSGCVKYSDGEIQYAPPPFTTDRESVACAGPPIVEGSSDGDGEDKGFCVGSGTVNLPTEEEKNWLTKLTNLEIPDLEAWMLSGFTAKIQEMMGKLNQVLGKLSAEVDKIMAKVVIDDECSDDMKEAIGKFLAVMKKLMALMPVLKKIITVIKIIRKVIKLVRKILKWTPPFVVPIIEALMKVLNIMGLVDMCVSLLIKTVGRFTTIIPVLQVQLMSILAMCAAQAGDPLPDNKEDCEAAGGIWIDPQDLKDLQDMYDKISLEDFDIDEDESIGFCSITEHLDKKSCEEAGGTWTDLDVDTNFDDVDTTALTNELANQMEELNRCFANPILQDYLKEL